MYRMICLHNNLSKIQTKGPDHIFIMLLQTELINMGIGEYSFINPLGPRLKLLDGFLWFLA